MRKLTLIMLLLMAPSVVRAEDQSVMLEIENMTCATCPIAVRTVIKGVPGVKDVKVDFARKTALVVFDDSLAKPAQFAEASRLAGFPAAIKD